MSNKKFRSGVLFGDELSELYQDANKNDYAIPAVNVTGSNTINAVLETARDLESPVIIQLSNGGASFYAGKGLSNADQKASIHGGVAAASQVHLLAKEYDVPVVQHTDRKIVV